MEIIDKRAIGEHKFGMLHCGDVFVAGDNDIYMKMLPCSNSYGKIFDAVNLFTGRTARFESENMVKLVKATLTIEDKI